MLERGLGGWVGLVAVGGGVFLQVSEDFLPWPRKSKAKKRSADRSPTKGTSRGPKNVYEDSDSENSEEIIVRD